MGHTRPHVARMDGRRVMTDTRLKLAEQNLARFTASLAWVANKDEVEASIAATKRIIRELKEGKS